MKDLFKLMLNFVVALSASDYAYGQNDDSDTCASYYDKEFEKMVYYIPQVMAEYPTGDVEMLKFISENLKPQKQTELQGKINLHLIIDDNGTILRIRVIRGRNKDSTDFYLKYIFKTEEEYTPYDKEFIRIIKTMPPWTPAKCDGVNVASIVSTPVRFNPGPPSE